MWKFLERIGIAATLIDLLAKLLPAGVLSGVVAVWAYFSDYGPLPLTLAAGVTFVSMFWLVIGILWIRDRRKPPATSIAWNYSFGVTIETIGVVPIVHEDGQMIRGFETSFDVRNTTTHPVIFLVTRSQAILEGRVTSRPLKIMPVILPANSMRSFNAGMIPATPGLRMDLTFSLAGEYDIELKYGHPEFGLFRTYSASGPLHAQKLTDTRQTRSVMVYSKETDVPLDKPELVLP